MFIQKLQTWTDLLRYNAQDGKMTNIMNDLNTRNTNKTFDYNFNTWINQFCLILEDNINQINSATAGYRGLKINSTSNSKLEFKMYDYSLDKLNP